MTQLDRKQPGSKTHHRKSRSERASSSSSTTAADAIIDDRRHQRKSRRRGAACRKFRAFMWSIVVPCLILLHQLKDRFLDLFLAWLWRAQRRRAPCPALDEQHDWLRRSPFELARMIRSREITAEQLFEACVRRIEQVNPMLNALVDGPFVDARDTVRSIDERIAAGEIDDAEWTRRPLLGVPFTIKDSTAAKGRLQTLGLLSRSGTRAKVDAECVRLVQEAGGILLATTNVPEVNRWQESRNLLTGQTNNPYDLRRTVGGSSGGEAAAITACMSPFGLGTDIGGSIRMPAFYCGIFGHKPTAGAINTFGCTFRAGTETSTMVVAGPMCRYAGDLLPLMRILCSPQSALQLRLNEEPAPDPARFKYYYVRESGELRCSPVAQELQSTMTEALEHLTAVCGGRRPEEVRLPCTEYTSKMWRYWMTQEPADFNAMLGNGRRLNAFVELGKMAVGRGEFTMASIYSLLDAAVLPVENEAKAKEYTRQCDEELTRLLGDDGILLYHSTTGLAPFHYAPLVNIYNFSYWALFNVLHVPSTSVPMGLSADGRPLGLQVVATRNRDRDCLAVAEELGRAFGGWRAPF